MLGKVVKPWLVGTNGGHIGQVSLVGAMGGCSAPRPLTVPVLPCRFPFPMVFSSCSKKDLEASLEKGMGMCLFNLPEVKQSFGGQKCGNGYVEQGEECDCGEPEVRDTSRDPCLASAAGKGTHAGKNDAAESARNSGWECPKWPPQRPAAQAGVALLNCYDCAQNKL